MKSCGGFRGNPDCWAPPRDWLFSKVQGGAQESTVLSSFPGDAAAVDPRTSLRESLLFCFRLFNLEKNEHFFFFFTNSALNFN